MNTFLHTDETQAKGAVTWMGDKPYLNLTNAELEALANDINLAVAETDLAASTHCICLDNGDFVLFNNTGVLRLYRHGWNKSPAYAVVERQLNRLSVWYKLYDCKADENARPDWSLYQKVKSGAYGNVAFEGTAYAYLGATDKATCVLMLRHLQAYGQWSEGQAVSINIPDLMDYSWLLPTRDSLRHFIVDNGNVRLNDIDFGEHGIHFFAGHKVIRSLCQAGRLNQATLQDVKVAWAEWEVWSKAGGIDLDTAIISVDTIGTLTTIRVVPSEAL